MNIKTQRLNKNISSRLWINIPYVIALVTIIFLAWSASFTLAWPHDGILRIHPTGLIGELDPTGPAVNKLQVGDIIKYVDGVPQEDAYYANKYSGDIVQFIVLREGKNVSVEFNLVDPPSDEILRRLMPLLVALVFWVVGVGVQAYSPAKLSTIWFYLFCQTSAVLLATGLISGGLPRISGLFNFLLWLIGPLSVHLHLHFPQTLSLRGQRYWLALLYAMAALGGLPYLVLGPQTIQSVPAFAHIFIVSSLFLVLNLSIVVALLFYSYHHATIMGVRGEIRIVVLGGVLSALPFIILTVLPDAVLKQTIVPYDFAFLFLGILPITYGYAIFRHRLIEIEDRVNRGATYILVFSILGGFYLILYAIIYNLLPITLVGGPFIGTLLALVLAGIYVPLRRRVQSVVDTVFYGGWYDYRSAVTQITQGLEQITDLRSLAETVSQRLITTLRLEDACVFLRDIEGDFSVIEVAPRDKLGERSSLSFSVLPKTSLTYLLKIGAVERASLREALSEVSLSPEELQLLASEQVNLWVPVLGQGQVQGLLALGQKFGGDVFSGEDLDILRIVAMQIGPVIGNIHLLSQLRQYTAELEQRVIERTAELHDAKERVEAILASVGDGVIVTDLEGSILTVNAAFEEQSGYPAFELLGQKLYDLLSQQNDPGILEDLRKTLSNGEIWSGELKNKRNGGGQIDIHLTIAPVRDQSGQIVSYVGSQRDITRQKELDRLKDLFVADVSHELRTPTTNIGLYLELLEGASPEKSREFLAVIRQQSQLLGKLVDDILDLSRLAMKNAKGVESTFVDLNPVIDEVIAAHQLMTEAAGLALVFEPELDLPPVWGDQSQLERMVTNLVSNAIRYTLVGEVWVRTYTLDGQICLEIRDTGIGIAPEDMPHIFARFYRGEMVRQTKIHGTGLGLSIVKEIVDFHRGEIEVDSKIDVGSSFIVRLPRGRD